MSGKADVVVEVSEMKNALVTAVRARKMGGQWAVLPLTAPRHPTEMPEVEAAARTYFAYLDGRVQFDLARVTKTGVSSKDTVKAVARKKSGPKPGSRKAPAKVAAKPVAAKPVGAKSVGAKRVGAKPKPVADKAAVAVKVAAASNGNGSGHAWPEAIQKHAAVERANDTWTDKEVEGILAGMKKGAPYSMNDVTDIARKSGVKNKLQVRALIELMAHKKAIRIDPVHKRLMHVVKIVDA